MKKKDIIERLKSLLWENGDGFFSFCHTIVPFHFDSCKYDLTAIYVESETNVLTVECVGYSSYGLKYLNAEELSCATLKKIEKFYHKYADAA